MAALVAYYRFLPGRATNGSPSAPTESLSFGSERQVRGCTRSHSLLRRGLGDETACDARNHRDPDVPGKEVSDAIVDGVESPIAPGPGEQPLDLR